MNPSPLDEARDLLRDLRNLQGGAMASAGPVRVWGVQLQEWADTLEAMTTLAAAAIPPLPILNKMPDTFQVVIRHIPESDLATHGAIPLVDETFRGTTDPEGRWMLWPERITGDFNRFPSGHSDPVFACVDYLLARLLNQTKPPASDDGR